MAGSGSDTCPDCGSIKYQPSGGCHFCPECGFSPCSA